MQVQESDPFRARVFSTGADDVHGPTNTGLLSRADGAALGLSIKSAVDPTSGLKISEVVPDGQAHKVGFRDDMTIVAINGTPVLGFTQQQAGAVITAAQTAELTVDRPLVGVYEMARTDTSVGGANGASADPYQDPYQVAPTKPARQSLIINQNGTTFGFETCGLLSQHPLVPGVPTKTRLECNINNFIPPFGVNDCVAVSKDHQEAAAADRAGVGQHWHLIAAGRHALGHEHSICVEPGIWCSGQ